MSGKIALAGAMVDADKESAPHHCAKPQFDPPATVVSVCGNNLLFVADRTYSDAIEYIAEALAGLVVFEIYIEAAFEDFENFLH